MINYQILASRDFMLFVIFFLIYINSILLHNNIPMSTIGIHSRMAPVIFTERHSLNLPQPVQEATHGQPGTPDTLRAVTSGNTLQQLSDCRGEHQEMHDLL